MANKDDDYMVLLLEQIRDQNRVLMEGQRQQATREDITELREAVVQLQADVKVIKAVVTDHSRELANYEHRIARLEAA